MPKQFEFANGFLISYNRNVFFPSRRLKSTTLVGGIFIEATVICSQLWTAIENDPPFFIDRSKLIAQVLRREQSKNPIKKNPEQEKPTKPLPASRTWQKTNYSKSKYTARNLKQKPKNLTPL